MQSSCGVSFANGYLYVADGSSVRKVGLGAGWLTTPAGDGTIQPYADGIPAAKASLRAACQTAVDQSGNLLIAEQSNNRIRAVASSTGTFYGQAMTAGDIYTVAGGGYYGLGDGGPATSAALSGPHGVMVDGAGNLVIADTGDNRIRVVASSTGSFYGTGDDRRGHLHRGRQRRRRVLRRRRAASAGRSTRPGVTWTARATW